MTKEALELKSEMPTLGPESLIVEHQRTILAPKATTLMVLEEVQALRFEVQGIRLLLRKIIKWSLVALTLLILLTSLSTAFGQQTINWDGNVYWDASPSPAGQVAGYDAYKGPPGGPYTKINTALITALTFNDPVWVDGDCYSVKVVGTNGLSPDFDNEVCVVVAINPLSLRFVFSLEITVP